MCIYVLSGRGKKKKPTPKKPFALVRPSFKTFEIIILRCCVLCVLYNMLMFGCAQSTHSTQLDCNSERRAVIIMLMTLQPSPGSRCHSLPDVYASAHKSQGDAGLVVNLLLLRQTHTHTHRLFQLKGIKCWSWRKKKKMVSWHQHGTKFKTRL